MMGWLLKLATGNPLTLLWIAGGIFLAAASGGWVVQGWRMGAVVGPLKAEVSRLQARSTILGAANDKCKADVDNANKATGRLLAQAKAREQKAQEAVRIAQGEAASLATSIAVLRAMPVPVLPPDALCASARGLLVDEVASRAK